MKIGEICTRDPVTVSVAASVGEAAQRMVDEHVGALIVTESRNRRAVGMITDRDVVRAQINKGADFSRLGVGDVMTPGPLLLNENDLIENALRHMQARGVRRAPVVNNADELVGLVSTDDLLAEISEELVNLGYLIGQQRRREAAAGSSL